MTSADTITRDELEEIFLDIGKVRCVDVTYSGRLDWALDYTVELANSRGVRSNTDEAQALVNEVWDSVFA
jgi:hypothetical protein